MGRIARLTVAAFVMGVSALSYAQGWMEYVNRAERFGVNFPAEPSVEDITHMGERGGTYPGRVYTAQEGSRRYSVTVIDYEGAEPTVVRGAVAHAAWNFRKRGGEIFYDAFAQVDRIDGHQLHITNADQSVTYAGMYQHEYRLYILEATVPPGSPPPVHFQYSLIMLDEDGAQVRYDVDAYGRRTVRIDPDD